jgi:hypothetical protein
MIINICLDLLIIGVIILLVIVSIYLSKGLIYLLENSKHKVLYAKIIFTVYYLLSLIAFIL